MKKRHGFILFGITLIVGFWTVLMLGSYSIIKDYYPPTRTISEIQKDTLEYCYYECTIENVYSEIMKADIKFSEIVLRQCLLETGYFTSYNCTVRNNLFGMKGGTKDSNNVHGYKVFEHWTKSVHDYKDWQERNYGDSDLEYYSFLESIGYAESTEYISKLKSIKLIIVKQ